MVPVGASVVEVPVGSVEQGVERPCLSNLVLSYEASAHAAQQSFRDAMPTAVNILDVTICSKPRTKR